jgi:5-methylcytosine-specific restriction endonuclease McrA
MRSRKQYTGQELWEIFYMVSYERCHLCTERLEFRAYGRRDHPRGWVVEHRNPFSRGGVEDLRNLRASCFSCNEKKGDQTTPEYRRSQPNGGYSQKSWVRDTVEFYTQKVLSRNKITSRDLAFHG